MAKLFIENANKEASAQIRIYPLDENSQVIAPDSFTSMDDLGLSFGVALTPKPQFECKGTLSRTGGILANNPAELSVTVDDINTPVGDVNELSEVLTGFGLETKVLTRWKPAEIKCAGGLVETPWIWANNYREFEAYVDGVKVEGIYSSDNIDTLRVKLLELGVLLVIYQEPV